MEILRPPPSNGALLTHVINILTHDNTFELSPRRHFVQQVYLCSSFHNPLGLEEPVLVEDKISKFLKGTTALRLQNYQGVNWTWNSFGVQHTQTEIGVNALNKPGNSSQSS